MISAVSIWNLRSRRLYAYWRTKYTEGVDKPPCYECQYDYIHANDEHPNYFDNPEDKQDRERMEAVKPAQGFLETPLLGRLLLCGEHWDEWNQRLNDEEPEANTK